MTSVGFRFWESEILVNGGCQNAQHLSISVYFLNMGVTQIRYLGFLISNKPTSFSSSLSPPPHPNKKILSNTTLLLLTPYTNEIQNQPALVEILGFWNTVQTMLVTFDSKEKLFKKIKILKFSRFFSKNIFIFVKFL